MSHGRRVAVIGVAVLLAVLAVAAVAGLVLLGGDAVHGQAVAFAAVVAGGGAVAGWLVARQARGRQAAVAVAGGLGATVVRMLPLLVALAWLVGQGGASWAGPAAGLLVAFHLVLLATDMVLHSLADGWTFSSAARDRENRPSAGADSAN